MEFLVEIWLRGDNHATTVSMSPVDREPKAWTDGDVVIVLESMLRALERAKNPAVPADRPVSLRGFSWIVSPFETGGVVIAMELSLGAVVAGPFNLSERQLSTMIDRVVTADRTATPTTIH